MTFKSLCIATFLAILTVPGVKAATADEWKSRSIYQVLSTVPLLTDKTLKVDLGCYRQVR